MNTPQPPVAPSESSYGTIVTQMAEQIQQMYKLSNSPEDQCLVELAAEVDHQAELYSITTDSEVRSKISNRRAVMIQGLNKSLCERLRMRTEQSETRVA